METMVSGVGEAQLPAGILDQQVGGLLADGLPMIVENHLRAGGETCLLFYSERLAIDTILKGRQVAEEGFSILSCVVIGQQGHPITTARRNNDGPMTFDDIDDKQGQRRRSSIGKPCIKLKLLIRGR